MNQKVIDTLFLISIHQLIENVWNKFYLCVFIDIYTQCRSRLPLSKWIIKKNSEIIALSWKKHASKFQLTHSLKSRYLVNYPTDSPQINLKSCAWTSTFRIYFGFTCFHTKKPVYKRFLGTNFKKKFLFSHAVSPHIFVTIRDIA